MRFLHIPRVFLPLGLVWALALHTACGPTESKTPPSQDMSTPFDWQGHRGMRGLLPENTVPAFLGALAYPAITTLELDVVASKDGQLVVSHEPWFSHEICNHPDGSPVTEAQAMTLNLYRLTAEEIRAYDCGSRPHSRFPEQKPTPAHKPTLREMVEAVEAHLRETNRPPVAYNIELKSRPEWYGTFVPDPVTFVRMALAEVNALGIRSRTCIQSFDKQILRDLHAEDPDITTALLIENTDGIAKNVAELGFTPSIYSPYYQLVTANAVQTAHEKGMKIIPWTVNDAETMKTLMDMGVDGIITDYPDRIPTR